jgi:S-adenosylmethionine:tRNA ribosyltransferase-isomerase
MNLAAPTEDGVPQATRLADYDYELPRSLIAQTPAAERDRARLLVLDRARGIREHTSVNRLPGWLRRGDLLVFNDTRVVPARLFGRAANGCGVELLPLHASGTGTWQCLGRPAKRLRPGAIIGLAAGMRAVVCAAPGGGRYAVRFEGPLRVVDLMKEHGEVPLPPYIRRGDGPLPMDRERYQTIFAARDGAVAAPTAGLHFTPALLEAVRRAGVETASLTLHVGPATFLPVREDDPTDHPLEAEWAEVPAATITAIEATRARGGRVVAVGTTTTRALESAAQLEEGPPASGFWASAFIRPGFRFRVVDALLTNFHLPRSTPLMLVGAFAGHRAILEAYEIAVRERYRFYSYGDAMFVF